MPKTITGGCMCGAVRYRAGRPLPMSTVVCNCKECQRSSGSAGSIVFPVRTSTFQLEGEPLATFQTTGDDSGEDRARKFCAKCGSPIVSILGETPELTWIKAGTLDDRSWLKPAMEVWCGSAQPWTRRLGRRPRLRRGPPSFSLRAMRPLLRAFGAISRG